MQVAPNQISPGENFDIFYFLRNHTDATTYYVQAKVYDIRTWVLLQTVNLTQATTNSRLFTKTVQAPADSSGTGRNIVAIATVYTDSGYTTKSTDYEEQENYFLVKTILPILGSGGIDYRTVRELMDEALAKAIGDLPKPQQVTLPDMPFEAVFGAIGALQREINRIPKDDIDLSGISQGLAGLHDLIANQPDPDQVDLGPIEEAVNSLSFDVAQLADHLEQMSTESKASIEEALRTGLTDLEKSLEGKLTKTIEAQQLTIPVMREVMRPAAPTPAPLDISHLMK